jgi:hypothetical protein
MNYNNLTQNQKRWYHALWDVTGGAISPQAIANLYPETQPIPPTPEIIAIIDAPNAIIGSVVIG